MSPLGRNIGRPIYPHGQKKCAVAEDRQKVVPNRQMDAPCTQFLKGGGKWLTGTVESSQRHKFAQEHQIDVQNQMVEQGVDAREGEQVPRDVPKE